MNFDNKRNGYFAWGLTALIVILAAVGVIFMMINIGTVYAAIKKIIGILMPVIYGIILAYLMSYIYNAVFRFVYEHTEKRFTNKKTAKNLSKAAATVLAVTVLIAIVAGLLSMMLPELVRSISNVISSAPENINNFTLWLNQTLEGDHQYREEILALYNAAIEIWDNFVTGTLKPNLDIILHNAYVSVRSIAVWIYNIIIGLIVMIYLLNFKDTLLPQMKKLIYVLFPEQIANRISRELKFIHTVFGGFIIGKIVDSIIIGIMCFVIVSIAKMPYALLVSVIVGVTNVIPFFGPFIGAIPSIVLIMLVSPKKALLFTLIILLLQQFDGNILGPKILGDKTGIPSFWVLFSILLFGGLFGFVGMIIAVPTWAVILHLVKDFGESRLRKKNLPTASEVYQDK